MKPRVLQLFAAGMNCDRELAYAWKAAGAEVKQVHVQTLIDQPNLLEECKVFSIPGGFTYGDDLGAGKILALEVNSQLGPKLEEFHDNGGTIFGPCNGFQVLVQMGLLPGVAGVSASLTWNASHQFECRRPRLQDTPALGHILPANSLLPAPSAHAEGQLVLAHEGDLEKLRQAGVIAFLYADADGNPTQDYPYCPNGSVAGIAGLVSPSGRIIGLMPHPERNLSKFHLPDHGAGAWGNGRDGLAFFKGMLAPYLAPQLK